MTDKEQVIQALRATLLSVKGALTLRQCNSDYKELQGEWIPYKKLGYQTLDQLFREVPGFTVRQVNGDWLVDAIASQETQHIAAMVSRQKTSKKPPKHLNYPNRFPKNQGSWRKPAQQSNYHATNNYSSYNSPYSKQHYRAKNGAPYYNNNYNNKYGVKSNDSSAPQYNKINTITKSSNEQTEKPKSYNAVPPPQVKKDIPLQPTEPKQTRTTSEPEIKPLGKISASQRLSNLRERLNAVDVMIPLQLPATTNSDCLVESSGPVTHVTPAHALEPPPDSISSVAKLEWTCKKLGLPAPVFKVQDIRAKRGPVLYDCIVKVGAAYYATSYPDSSPSEELAKEVGAVKILAIIESSDKEGLPTSSAGKAVNNLANLVAEHEAGIWASTVPHLYREKYEENLPSNWQELIENCPRIIKDRVVNGLLVLLPNNEESAPPIIESNYSSFDDSLDSELPALQFPDDEFWNVYVTVANSTLEIWIRIIGPEYSDAFESLLADMAKYYDYSGTRVDKSMLLRNAWYAVNLEEGGWHRAKILEIEDESATVFLGDHGDDDIVSIHQIKILEPQFRKLPAQAILCRLDGAEELAVSEAGAEITRGRLPGEVLVAAPRPRHDPDDPAVAVVLYDTTTHRDLNLNKEIVHDFCTAGSFTVTQKPCEVEVGCVTEEGRVWVSRAGGAGVVSEALALLTAGPYRRPLPAAPRAPPPAHNALYIVRTLAGHWVRCTIISGLDGEGTVRTQLVDSGLILRAPISSLVPLATFSPALNAYPHQAMQVRLGSGAERAAPSMIGRLKELLLNSRVLCRGLSSSSTPPSVELFVRTGPKNILASVNNSILMEYEFLNQAKPGEEDEKESLNPVEVLNRKKERIFRPSGGGGGAGAGGGEERGGGTLPPPALPAVGKCFDVHVAMAANPWNFVVQPNSTRHTLLTMMASLQAECPKLSEADAPTNPASGELYTVFYDKDDCWYRVTIAGTVSSEMVTVYFCDYGDLSLFAHKQLRPVPAAAPLARSLPPQAIKAKLYDLWPLHQDWTVEDCIRFQELCVDQQFVGICKEVGKDPLNPNEPLLTLDLVDTSTDEDIYLNKQLVNEGRARLASASS